MLSAGISILTVHLGCQTVSTARCSNRKDSVNSWVHLWNTYAFYVLYANIDEFDPTKYSLEYDKLSVMDKWLLSKLNSCVKTVDDCLANYKIPETAKALTGICR